MKKATLFGTIILFGMIGLLIIKHYHFAHHSLAKKTAVALLNQADVTQVKTQDYAKSIVFSGSLYPLTQTTIISKVSGEIQKVNILPGQQVNKNQVIATIDPNDLTQTVLQDQALLLSKQATYQNDKNKLSRYKKLFQEKYYSASDFDDLKSQVALDNALVKQAQASLQEAKLQLGYTQISSPISGIVSERDIDQGENVSPGTTLFKVVNLNKLQLKAIVPANQINLVHINDVATFTISGFAEKFKGIVCRINPSIIANTRAFYVYINVDNPQGLLRDGLFANGKILIKQFANSLIIPYSALHKNKNHYYVYAIANGIITKQPVGINVIDQNNNKVALNKGVINNQWIIQSAITFKNGEHVELPNQDKQHVVHQA